MEEKEAKEINARIVDLGRLVHCACAEMLDHLASLRAALSDLLVRLPDHPQRVEWQEFLEGEQAFSDFVKDEIDGLLPDDTEEWFKRQMGGEPPSSPE